LVEVKSAIRVTLSAKEFFCKFMVTQNIPCAWHHVLQMEEL